MKIDFKAELKKCGLDHPEPFRFTQARWIRNDKVTISYLIYKVILALFWFSVFVIDLVTTKRFYSDGDIGHFAYATTWGMLVVVFTIIYDSSLVLVRFVRESMNKYDSIPPRSMSIPLKISWFWTTTTFSVSIFITIIYWSFLSGDGHFSALANFDNIAVHALQTLTVVIDVLASSRPTRPHHFWMSLTCGSIYLIFNIIYVAGLGYPPVYPMLDWHQSPGASVGFCFATAAAVIVIHFILFGMTYLRDLLWTKLYP